MLTLYAYKKSRRFFYDELLSNEKIKQKYDFVIPPAFSYAGNSDGELLMIKKKFKATLYKQVALENSKQFRFFSCGRLVVNGVKIGIGTAHLESVFFTREFTSVKAAQLGQICKTLDGMDLDCYIVAGDCNLTGGAQLKAENKSIEDLKLIDVWKFFNVTTERYDDPKYRENDVTWDGARNKNVRYQEFHRPDRVFMRCFSHKLEPASMERPVTNMSDHYPLTAVFRTNTN